MLVEKIFGVERPILANIVAGSPFLLSVMMALDITVHIYPKLKMESNLALECQPDRNLVKLVELVALEGYQNHICILEFLIRRNLEIGKFVEVQFGRGNI